MDLEDDDVATLRPVGHFATTMQSGHNYSDITASGNSRVHNGNVYYFACISSAGHGLSPSAFDWTRNHELERSPPKRKRPDSDVGHFVRKNKTQQFLQLALEDLGGFSKSMMLHKTGEQSKKLAMRVMAILDAFGQAGDGLPLSQDVLDQVQEMRRRLKHTKRIAINAKAPRSKASTALRADTKSLSIIFSHWEISLTTKTTESRGSDGNLGLETCSALRVRSKQKSGGPQIAVFVSEKTDAEQTISLHPIVTAYNTIDSNSRIFQLVENDDLRGLMRLLATGEASTRDCTEEGHTLLYYACFHASPEICKFLVDCGADIDLVVRDPFDVIKGLLQCFRYLDQEAPTEALMQSIACRKALLQAGADPTILDSNSFGNSPLVEALGETPGGGGSTMPLEVLLHEGSAFIDLRKFQADGQSLWLFACAKTWKLSDPAILRVLITAGADVAETDGKGWNCLFHCVLESRFPDWDSEFRALRFLLNVLDDLFATDVKGRSIFDYFDNDDSWSHVGTYRQDMWYCALYRSALEARHVISPPPQAPEFTEWYTSQHYRAMLYLTSWSLKTVRDHDLTNDFPLSAQQREQAPGFSEWDPARLLDMEERARETIAREYWEWSSVCSSTEESGDESTVEITEDEC